MHVTLFYILVLLIFFMAHEIVPKAEEILDKEYPVLNLGFVRLVDYLGGDERIVQSARVSYGKGTKNYRTDRGLIRYLMRHKHTSPFEQVLLSFHAKMPIFVARQWVRHRTARLNEISGRYSILKNEFYIPDKEHINPQSKDNKQGRSKGTYPAQELEEILRDIKEDQKNAYEDYKKLIGKDVAKELARINLPVSTYTEWYWNIDLHNLFHFLKLRMDSHAQYEIRAYADKMGEITKKVAPIAWEAFEDYQLNSITLSAHEISVVKKMINKNIDFNDINNFKAGEFVITDKNTNKQKLNNEGLELQKKLYKL